MASNELLLLILAAVSNNNARLVAELEMVWLINNCPNMVIRVEESVFMSAASKARQNGVKLVTFEEVTVVLRMSKDVLTAAISYVLHLELVVRSMHWQT